MGLPVGPPQGGTPLLPGPGQPAPLRSGEFQYGGVPQLTTFNIAGIAPPSPLYIGRDDQLLLGMTTNLFAGDSVTFSFRMLTAVKAGAAGGQPDTPAPAAGSLPPLTNLEFGAQTISSTTPLAVLKQQLVQLSEGFLLSIAATGNAVFRGQTLARAQIVRGPASALLPNYQLFSDYVTGFYSAGWPGGRTVACRETPGALTLNTKANPAAGADWNFLVPGGAIVKIITLNAQLVTNATAASRIPEIQVTRGGVPYATFTPNQFVPASTTAQVCTSSGSNPAAVAGSPDVAIPVPAPMWALDGDTIQSTTKNIQAGDQWSNIRLWLEYFCEMDG